jgi:hypothetical protein
MDESIEPEPEEPREKRTSFNQVKGVNTMTTPTREWFDPPLEYRPYEEIYEEVKEMMRQVERRAFRRRKGVK